MRNAQLLLVAISVGLSHSNSSAQQFVEGSAMVCACPLVDQSPGAKERYWQHVKDLMDLDTHPPNWTASDWDAIRDGLWETHVKEAEKAAEEQEWNRTLRAWGPSDLAHWKSLGAADQLRIKNETIQRFLTARSAELKAKFLAREMRPYPTPVNSGPFDPNYVIPTSAPSISLFNLAAASSGPCPPGFIYVGALDRSTNGLEVKEWVSIRLPAGLVLDQSYLQPSPEGKGGQAGTTLGSETIPRGIHIIPSGEGSFGWAVSDPRMIDPQTFQMYLYCSQDQGALNFKWGCHVKVDVCAKVPGASTAPDTPSQPQTAPAPARPAQYCVTARYTCKDRDNNDAGLQDETDCSPNSCQEARAKHEQRKRAAGGDFCRAAWSYKHTEEPPSWIQAGPCR